MLTETGTCQDSRKSRVRYALPTERSHTTTTSTTTEQPVGVHLREFRARLDLSAAEVARRADLPTSTLVDAELGIIEPTMIGRCAVLRILTREASERVGSSHERLTKRHRGLVGLSTSVSDRPNRLTLEADIHLPAN